MYLSLTLIWAYWWSIHAAKVKYLDYVSFKSLTLNFAQSSQYSSAVLQQNFLYKINIIVCQKTSWQQFLRQKLFNFSILQLTVLLLLLLLLFFRLVACSSNFQIASPSKLINFSQISWHILSKEHREYNFLVSKLLNRNFTCCTSPLLFLRILDPTIIIKKEILKSYENAKY